MELTFTQLRRKEVINLADGKRLGRVNDIVFLYPSGKISGFVVPSCQSFAWFKGGQNVFFSLECISKIGDDVILVNVKNGQASCGETPDKCSSPTDISRNYEDYE